MRIVRSGFRPTFLVAIWRGGAPIGIAVQETFEYHGIHADHIAIRTSSYTGIDQQSKTVRVHALDYLVSRLSFEDELLIIDDVFDSGRSLEAVIDELKRRCRRNLPDKIRIATVYYKPERNRSSLVPDYYVVAKPGSFFDDPPDVAGHGTPYLYDRTVPLLGGSVADGTFRSFYRSVWRALTGE